jgi:hypothetical protein
MTSCRYCGKEMKWLYPKEAVPYVMQWGHVSLEDAQNCIRPDGTWPHPGLT